MQRFLRILAASLAVSAAVALMEAAQAQNQNGEYDSSKEDEALLRKLQLPVDGKGLLQYFRERTYPEANRDEMARLVKQLGSANFALRENAFKKIQKFGSGALFSLKKFKDSADVETRQRIHQLLQRIEDNADPRVQAAVARLIAKRQPENAEEVLLQYTPFAADDAVIEEIRLALTVLTKADGNADPKLLGALKSKLPLLRRVAGEALARSDVKEQLPAVRKLLSDPHPKVRLQVALALAERKDKTAIPVLIDALAELPPEDLWQAENLLIRLAGDDTPEVSLGKNEAERKKTRAAWKKWWDSLTPQSIKTRLANLDKLEQFKGFVQVIYQTNARVVGGVVRRAGRQVAELGLKKDINKPRWNFVIENTYPVDVQVIGKNKILLAEYTGRRISIRDFDGRIKKTHYLPTYPIAAEKLQNGNTFVVMRNRLVEYNRGWKEVWSYNSTVGTLYRANKLRDGRVVIIDYRGRMYFLNPKTRQLTGAINVGQIGSYYGGLQVLRNGNILVPRYSNHQVVEYSPKGQIVWRANVQWPSTAVRLPNGDTIVGSLNTRRIVQLNRNGQEVWSRSVPGQVYRVRAR